MCAGDTSVIISSKKFGQFHTTSNIVRSQMSKWFSTNKLDINPDKINIIKFITKNSPQHTLSTGYKEKCVEESVNTKLLGLQIHNQLKWKNHIDRLVSKLSSLCYAVRSVSHTSNTDTLKSIYFP
jgi:hypothetical protein